MEHVLAGLMRAGIQFLDAAKFHRAVISAHCYAKTFAERWRGIEGHYYEHGFDVQLRPAKLEEPLKWKKPRRIFVNSMSDLFHEAIPDQYITEIFAVMAAAPQHTFQILTKRIERAEHWLTNVVDFDIIWDATSSQYDRPVAAWPLPNVLIGPTIENQHFADLRLPVLVKIHDLGWHTMVSYEPALGPVDFTGEYYDPVDVAYMQTEEAYRNGYFPARVAPAIKAISWLICGGESGSKRRPFNHEWARSALRQARDAGVPFWMKQDGAFRNEVYDTLPDDLRVREWPR